jgi:hypothetical protein
MPSPLFWRVRAAALQTASFQTFPAPVAPRFRLLSCEIPGKSFARIDLNNCSEKAHFDQLRRAGSAELDEIMKAVGVCKSAVKSAADMIGARANMRRRHDGTWEFIN